MTRLRVLSDVGGPIRSLVMQLIAGSPLGPLVDIATALRGARVVLVGDSEERCAAAASALARSGRLARDIRRLVVAEGELTSWPRDTFISGRDGFGAPVLLLRAQYDGDDPAADRRVPYCMVERGLTSGRVVQSPHFFEGGNLVTDDDQVFVGYDIIGDNVPLRTPEWERAAERSISRAFGRPLVVVGSADNPPPLGHIDMFLTPLGGGAVLVGDPVWGVEIISDLSRTARERYDYRFGGGDPDKYAGTPFSLMELAFETAQPDIVGRFDRLVRELRGLGFAVHRVPILLPGPAAELPILSYNNVVQEHDVYGRHVLVPRYGIDALDEVAARTWRRLGWRVSAIDLSEMPDLHGAVRCMTQILTRAAPRQLAGACAESRTVSPPGGHGGRPPSARIRRQAFRRIQGW